MQKYTPEKKRLALITGASSGIGASFARHAAAKGFDVALCARRLDRLEALANEIKATWPVNAFAIEADLAHTDSPHKIIESITARDRSVDVLINNAGFSIPKGFVWSSLEVQKRFLTVTIDAPMSLTHLALPKMIEKGWGRIINISSITAFSQGGKGHTLYPAGKSFLVKFSQSLNAEVQAHGIHVSAICPAFVKTEFHIANDMEDQIRNQDAWYWQTPEEIATEAWRRNERGVEVIVPGFVPKIAATVLKLVPEQFSKPFTRKAAESYYVGDG